MQVIYDMPHQEYLDLPRLSSSGIKKLLTSSQDFWKTSWMNPNKPEVESDAFNMGTAYHKLILEGEEAFDQAYAVKPECDRRTKEGKAIYAEFKEQYPDAIEIKQEVKDFIKAAAHRIVHKPHLTKYFSLGKPEVTMLWEDEETGVPMKARLDMLHDQMIVDLKTFSNSNDSDLKFLLTRHINLYGYHIQAAVYREAARVCLKKEDMDLYFVFQQTGHVNNTIPVCFKSDLLLAQKGADLMRQGINKFRDNYAAYGDSEWFDDDLAYILQDEDFPLYVYD